MLLQAAAASLCICHRQHEFPIGNSGSDVLAYSGPQAAGDTYAK